jgi:hypothetical protein
VSGSLQAVYLLETPLAPERVAELARAFEFFGRKPG